MLRKVRQKGLHLSGKRVIRELGEIREVINIYQKKRRQKAERRQTVFSKVTEVQKQLMFILMLDEEKKAF